MYCEGINQAHGEEEEEENTKLAYDKGMTDNTYPIQSPKSSTCHKIEP